MSLEPKPKQTISLHLTVENDRVPAFFPMLSQGFTIKTKVGCSVRNLICSYLGLSADYLELRLQTIFLDGKAVDNIETVLVHQGSTLALSAAMPGLAGATLRRGSAYAAMRDQITHKKSTTGENVKDGTIYLKLFNLVAEEIGQLFLTQGIWISGKNLQKLFKRVPVQFWAGCRAAEVDSQEKKVHELDHMNWETERVFLKLKVK